MIGTSFRQKKILIFGIVVILTIWVIFVQINEVNYPYYKVSRNSVEDFKFRSVVDDFKAEELEAWSKLRQNQTNLSKLGRILFLGEKEPELNTTKKYQILIWKYGHTIEKRLLKNFSDEWIDPFKECPVKNCDITYKDEALETADLVLVHLHRMKGPRELPPKRGKADQIWAFLTEESPQHTFLSADKNVTLKDYNGVFNWSMSYRTISDIPIPYGRTVLQDVPKQVDINLEKKRDVLVAIMGSNCGGKNKRWAYVKELQKHMKVDTYGGCGTLKCPGHFKKDCPLIDKYLFYLSFENSNCDEYITEKVWWNGYHKNSIPIVMGGSRLSYKKLLPPNSYINVEEFADPASLARFLLRLNETNEYLEYYQWKSHFEVLNEHGYFQSKIFHYCRVCQALNYNDKSTKIYANLEKDWGPNNLCLPAWNS